MFLNWWRKWQRDARGRATSSRPSGRRCRPTVESLEDRTVPAVSFGFVQNLATGGTIPFAVVSGDFNNDGILDVAVGNDSGSVGTLLGNGDGTFRAPIVFTLPGGSNADGLAVGDFNEDGNLDLAVADFSGEAVRILLGLGNGSFVTGQVLPFVAGAGPVDVAVGDFNNDGNLDLVEASFTSGFVNWYSGAGNGTFTLIANFNSGVNPRGLTVADLNGDGALDVAIAVQGSDRIAALINNNTAAVAFTPVAALITLPAGSGPVRVAAGDFDEDGDTDLAVANYDGDNVTTFLNAGGLVFNQSQVFAANAPRFVIAADFSGDGAVDLAVANFNSNNVTVLENRNDGTGTFNAAGAAQTFATGNGPRFLATGDFNRDGQIDLATANELSNTTTVLQNQSRRTYFAVGTGSGVASQVTIYNRDGSFAGSFSPFGTFTGGVRVAIGDVTNDGVDDLIVSSGPGGISVVVIYDGVSVLATPNTPTAFTAFNPFGVFFAGGSFVAVGNLDGQGGAELIVGADAGGGPQVNIYSNAQILARNLTGPSLAFYGYAFGPGLFFFGGVRVASADVDGDGRDDLITAAGPGGGPQIKVYLGRPAPNFVQIIGFTQFNEAIGFRSFYALGPTLPNLSSGYFVVGADFDGDGRADLAMGADNGQPTQPEVAIVRGITVVQSAAPTPTNAFFAIAPSTFPGGVRVGRTSFLSNGRLFTALLTSAGPGGNQLNVFDVFAFITQGTAVPVQLFGPTLIQGASSAGAYVSV